MFFSDKTLSDKCFQPDQVVKCTTFFPEATLKVVIRVDDSRYHTRLSLIILSNVLQTQFVRAMGL